VASVPAAALLFVIAADLIRRLMSWVPLGSVIAGHSASEDARERAYAPAIHPLRKKFLRRMMDPRVKRAGDRAQ